MASYLDSLVGDRERSRRALVALIESETAAIRELQANITLYSQTLDQQIIRLMVYRGIFGNAQAETLNAQVEVEEASKPHTAVLRQLQHRQRVLQALQDMLARLDRGEGLGAAGRAEDTKLTVADILGE